jgi:hypothetical protein
VDVNKAKRVAQLKHRRKRKKLEEKQKAEKSSQQASLVPLRAWRGAPDRSRGPTVCHDCPVAW